MAEEARIKAARKIRGILQGLAAGDRVLVLQLATIEGAPKAAPTADGTAVPKRRGRKPGPKPKSNGQAVEAAPAEGFKKDGTPRKRPGPKPKVATQEPTPKEVAETNAQVDAELGREQEEVEEVEQPTVSE